jgi:hypothetical protein
MQTPASQGKEDVEPDRIERFAYFMIRVRRGSLASAEGTLTELVEQLATGEKESFASAEELIRIVCRGPGAPARSPSALVAEQERIPDRSAAPDGLHSDRRDAEPDARELDDPNARAGR